MIITYLTLGMLITTSLLNIVAKVMLVGKKPPVLGNGVAVASVFLSLSMIAGLAFIVSQHREDAYVIFSVAALCFWTGMEMARDISRIGKETVVRTAQSARQAVLREMIYISLAVLVLAHI